MELLISSPLCLCGFNTQVGGKKSSYSSALSLLRFCSATITHHPESVKAVSSVRLQKFSGSHKVAFQMQLADASLHSFSPDVGYIAGIWAVADSERQSDSEWKSKCVHQYVAQHHHVYIVRVCQ